MIPQSIPFRWFLAALLATVIGLSSSITMGVVMLPDDSWPDPDPYDLEQPRFKLKCPKPVGWEK